MGHYLKQRFPWRGARVLELITSDAQLAEISEEYAEVCAALEELEAEGKTATLAGNELRRLQGELEEEISELLGNAGYTR